MSQYALTWGLPTIKKQRKYLSLLQRYYKLKFFVFSRNLTILWYSSKTFAWCQIMLIVMVYCFI